jgi:hypothetical protein
MVSPGGSPWLVESMRFLTVKPERFFVQWRSWPRERCRPIGEGCLAAVAEAE